MAPLKLAGIKHYPDHGGNFVDSTYLGHAFDNVGKPYQFQTMIKLFSAKNRFFSSMQKLVMQQTGRSNPKLEIDSEIYRWKLANAQEKFARSLENLESGNITPGINGTTFQVKLDVGYYREPDVLMPEDNEYLLEIIGEGRPDGIGTVYTVRIQGDSPVVFMPNSLMNAGKEFSKVTTSIQSELNSKYGTQQYSGYFMLEGQVGFFGQELVVTDRAWREDGRMDFKFVGEDENGNIKEYNRFLPVAKHLAL